MGEDTWEHKTIRPEINASLDSSSLDLEASHPINESIAIVNYSRENVLKEITDEGGGYFADTWRMQDNIYDNDEFSNDSVVLA